MTPGQLVLVALIFGIVVGALFTALVIAAYQRGQRALDVVDEPLPDGVAAVISGLDLPAIVVDGSGSAVTATPAARSLGLLVGPALVHPELEHLIDDARRQRRPQTADLQLRRSAVGDAEIDVRARATPIGAVAVLLIVEDDSESRRLESVRRDFVANVSHELKTPIGAVGLLAEAMHAAADDPEQVRRFADRLTAEASRLAMITREIIEFSRLQSVDPLQNADLVALDDVLDAAADQNRVAAEAKSIDVVLAKPHGLRVLGSATLLTSAVHNLLANAIQFSPEHGRIGIGTRLRDDVVEVTVTDQGVGIEAADLDRVFERFFRADYARSRSTGGTGLGLSIVKHVAQNHGGDVRVWSRPGQGSTFTVVLPAVDPDPLPKGRKHREREPA